MSPVDPTAAEEADEKPEFRSYFELLEAKYGDGESSPDAADEPTPVRPEPPPARHRAPGGGRRRETRQWIGTVAALLAVVAAFGALVLWMPQDWLSTPTAPEEPPPEAELSAAGQALLPADDPSLEPSPREPARRADGPAELPAIDQPRAARPAAPAADGADLESVPTPQPVDREPPSAGPSGSELSGAEPPDPGPSDGGPSDAGPSDAGPSDPVPSDPVPPAEVAASAPAPSPPARGRTESDESVSTPSATFERPRKVFAPQPGYPEAARRRAEQGTVTVRGTVTAAGDVSAARVVDGVSPTLDRAALEAFRTWQFIPAKRAGSPVDSPYRVAFHFQIDGGQIDGGQIDGGQIDGGQIDGGQIEGGDENLAGQPPSAGPSSAIEPGGPLPFGGDFTPPERRVTPLPSYPQEARASGASGDVVLGLVVETDGSVSRVEVLRGLGPVLDRAALRAVRTWQFTPARRGDEPVRVEHRVTLRFVP